jgi:multiple antibiotic resistance protein
MHPLPNSISDLLSEFIMMWVLIDPIGTIPVFLGATAKVDPRRRNAIATRAVIIAGVVLVFFIVAGRLLLQALDIPLMSFQMAGGIVLFLFALTMIFGESKVEAEKDEIDLAKHEHAIAAYPLAIPSIASPGAMLGAVLLTDTEGFSIPDQALSIATTLVVLGATLGLLWAAGPIQRFIGESGASVLSRIMGLLLAAVAVNNVISAFATYFHISAT